MNNTITIKVPINIISATLESWMCYSVLGKLKLDDRQVDLLFFDENIMNESIKWTKENNHYSWRNDKCIAPMNVQINFKLIKE